MICLGCGRDIGWDGKGIFCYTCSCGATVFVGDQGLALPASLGMGLVARKLAGYAAGEKDAAAVEKDLAHIDYYVGVSNHNSEQKRDFVKLLRARGHTWSWECAECREKGRCPFRWQCSRFKSPSPDDRAVIHEVCLTVRHLDCALYQELRDQLVAIEERGGTRG